MKKTIPKKDLYIAILDDAKEDSYRLEWFERLSDNYGQPKRCNILTTGRIDQFTTYADSNREALLFIDPGVLGNTGSYGVEYKEDRELYKWLKKNPSRIIHVIYTVHKMYYEDIQVLTLKDQINDISYIETQYFVDLIIIEWLFKNNPLALFGKDVVGWKQVTDYIPNLHEPLVSAICKQLGIGGKTVTSKKVGISEYYRNTWMMEMRRRGVKGY